MGYRSDVAYVVEFNSMEDRDAYVVLLLASDNPEVVKAIEECKTDYKKDPRITYACSDVKWYESYADVQAHTHVYLEAANLYDASYRFIRVGEEDGDVEKQEQGEAELWEVLDVRVELTYDFEEEP